MLKSVSLENFPNELSALNYMRVSMQNKCFYRFKDNLRITNFLVTHGAENSNDYTALLIYIWGALVPNILDFLEDCSFFSSGQKLCVGVDPVLVCKVSPSEESFIYRPYPVMRWNSPGGQ